ncbi:MAG: S8 family peptidase [Ekhidna sp.]|uniref:S8 family peptidase n=1 Tax=Ekhidna sp. TaxID=2608089 RepID=UPI0032EB25D3
MRGIVLSLVMIVWYHISFSQNEDGWRGFTKSSVSDESQISLEKFYLIEASKEELFADDPSIEILRSVDQSHHIVRLKEAVEFERIWEVNNQWKLNLIDSKNQQYYIVSESSLQVMDGLKIIREFPDRNTYLVEGKLQDVERLSDRPDILHITNKVFEPVTEARVIDMNLNPNRVNKIHHNFPTLNGITETVSVQENQFDVEDIDLLNRSIPSGLESEIIDNHASEMATIIAGAGNSFITGQGVAIRASLTSSDFADAMPDADNDYLNLNINIQNHSYGIERASEYGVQTRAFDLSAFNNKYLLHIFSSGNAGQEIPSDGIYAGIEGFANLTGNIKMTKNSLVVGSVDTVGAVPAFVSRGPAYDGRVKPEVVAYSVVGSSNSAALVSGVSLLLHQQYGEDNIGEDMPSALTKAILINSAVDVGAPGLDFITGYGNINAWRSLQTLQNGQFDSGTVANGETETFALNLPANAINLKVTLCWTDRAANVNDFPALVNDLDLRLIDGSMNTTLPWVLDASPNISDLSKPATRGIDNLNNVEQVTIANPETNYTIEIEGSAVSGSQEFFIAWQYDIEDTFEWDFPTGSDNMPYNGETGSYFRWTTTRSGTGELSYSTDEINWIVLDDVNLADGYWRWNNPPNINDEVKARMVIGEETFETDFFTVSEPLSARVGFNCGDSLMLKWKPSLNAVDYTVYTLGNETLEEYATVSDTFLIIPNTLTFNSSRFSIQPNLPSGKELLGTPTFDYTQQGVGCFVFSFFQTVALDTGIYLNLTLGTTYGIEEIIFERNERSNFIEIGTVNSLSSEQFAFLDDSPNQGFNEHRATVRFINGEELMLTAGTTYYLTEIPLRIFPNPVLSGDFLTIITREFEERTPLLELIDDRGALIHSQRVEGNLDEVPTEGLKSGIYFYRLIADGEIYTGRILVR